jgi:hypothetical protein
VLNYLPEYVRRLSSHWFVRVGFVAEFLALVALYAVGVSLGQAGWIWPTLGLVGVALWSGFVTFQEERSKTDDGVYIERLESKYATAIQRMNDGKVWAHMPIRLKLRNRNPVNPARLIAASLVWKQKRLMLPIRTLRTIPLVDHHDWVLTHPGKTLPALDVVIPPADSSEDLELVFDASWVRDQTFRWPKRSPIFIELTILGAPNISEHVTTVDSPDWSHPNSVLDLFPTLGRKSS